MIEKLNADGFIHNVKTYNEEFKHLLRGIVLCYKMMIKDNVELINDEGTIRNKLLIDYLNNDSVRDITKLTEFTFNKEVSEDKTKGRTDIKIEIKNPFRTTAAYYIIECKRLDNKNTKGISGLNAEYIKNGIYRFVNDLYSTNCNINGMIGFIIEDMDIHSNIKKINILSKDNFREQSKMINEITQEYFIHNFDYHYSSTHYNSSNNRFTIFHLMLDMNKCIKKKE